MVLNRPRWPILLPFFRRKFAYNMEGEVPSKKLRKPYTITRPRDRWTSEEHDRFLEALLQFGRDWKKIEDFVGTKTTIQESLIIRSHAQKYFLKIQKIGLSAHVPPPHSRRKTGPHQQHQISSVNDITQSEVPLALPMGPSFMPTCNSWDTPSTSSHVLNYTTNNGNTFAEYLGGQGSMRSSNLDDQNSNINWAESSSQAYQNDYALVPPISNPPTSVPAMPNLCQVYSFIGNMFDPETTRPIEIFIEKLKQVDPVTRKALLTMIRNLTIQISGPNFQPLDTWFSTYDPEKKTIGKYPLSLS
ncbi:Homeodomain-like superfamily protein [Rhynchospora pubera]|uniref:Homeodomain-like superfamily protein n=1 Tax=Rhynchospora pubera TaxID=906938 RepID=A0AAV8EUD2_9POAL|nr:Homeodomain-like superfamily protein [Rhynchospora pubera]